MRTSIRSLLGRRHANPQPHSNAATEQDVRDCYRLLLNKEPDEAGLAYWRSLIRTKQIPVSAIVDAMLKSVEFKALHAARNKPSLVECAEFKIYARANDLFIGKAIIQTREYEPHVAQQVRRLLRPGDAFVDVGANVGFFTLLAATLVGPHGKVIAFEPNSDNCDLLRHSLAQNKLNNVRLHQTAVAEAAGQIALSSGGADSNARIMRPEELHGLQEHFAHVEAVTLDEALQGESRIDLIKMDIEGAEPRAWQGMQAVLRNHRPALISEYSPDLIRATSNCDPRSYLEQLWQGHTVSILERSGVTRPVAGVQEIVDAHTAAATAGLKHLDLLALPRV